MHRRITTTVVGALSCALVLMGGLAFADQGDPTEAEPRTAAETAIPSEPPVSEPAPSEPTGGESAPSELASADPAPSQPASGEPAPIESAAARTSEPVAAVEAASELGNDLISPLAAGPDGAQAPYVYWEVRDSANNLIEGATVTIERRSNGGWVGTTTVTDCTAAVCTSGVGRDLDPDPGEFLVKQISGQSGTHNIAGKNLYSITPAIPPAGSAWSDTSRVQMTSNLATNGTHGFGTLKLATPSPQIMQCDAGVIYSVNATGQLFKVTNGSTTEPVEVGYPAASVSDFNGLGIGTNGNPIHAIERGRNGIATVYKFDTATGTWTNTGVSTGDTNTNRVAGAVNLNTGVYYFGGFVDVVNNDGDSNDGDFRIYQYNPGAGGTGGTVTLKGWLDINATTGASNGDIAFNDSGDLFVVRGNGDTTTIYSVTAANFTAASGGSIAFSTSAPITTMDNVNGVAFDADGKGFLGAAGEMRAYGMPGWTTPYVTSTLSRSTDLASCSSPPTITIEKEIQGGRAASGDQFKLELKQGTTLLGEATTTGTAGGLQGERVGPLPTVRNVALTFSEVAAGTTSMSNYASSYRCLVDDVQTTQGNATTGTITIPSSGKNVVCRFFNAPLVAKVTINKQVTDSAGANPQPRAGWTVGATATATAGTVSRTPNVTDQQTASNGSATWDLKFETTNSRATVSVSEGTQTGYQFQSGSCVVTHLDGTTATTPLNGAVAQSLTGVAPGDTVVCTYTNRPTSATVTVDKVWVINGTTVANGSQPDGLTATLALNPAGQPAGAPQWGQTRTGFVVNQSVNIAETTTIDPVKLPGCTLTGSTIAGSGISGSQNLPTDGHSVALPAETNAYTVTNSVQCQTLSIVKQVTNTFGGGLAPADWDGKLHATGTTGALNFNHNETKYVTAGEYQLTETAVPGYQQNGLTCTGATLTGNTVNITPGSAAVCTFVNSDQPGSVQVIKRDATDQQVLAGAVFELWRDLNSNGIIDETDTRVDPARTTPANGQVEWTSLAWGSYLVKEVTPPPGYELSSPTVQEFVVDATSVATQTVSFDNPRRLGTATWSKTDATDDSLLAGSTWSLTGPGVPAGTIVIDCVEGPCASGAFLDQDPTPGEFELTDLAWGSYTLTETAAPPGYELDPTPRQFTVGAGQPPVLDIDLGQIENEQRTGPVLPLTGGLGRDQIMIIGALMALLAVAGFGARRFRAQNS